MVSHNHTIKDINPDVMENDIYGKVYFPNTYYNSLDFIYKYTKEVIINELFGINKDFFKRINSNIEDHRFSRQKSINTNSLYNAAYPQMYINLTQDFSGPGKRTTMAQSALFYILEPDMMMKTMFYDRSMSIQLASNIFKYDLVVMCRFDSSMMASNFLTKMYNRVHMNKHFLPDRRLLRYRIDKALYRTIRKALKAEYDTEEDFLTYMDNHTVTKLIREFDRSTGNIDYFILMPIRPLVYIGQPQVVDDNTNGSRESVVTLNLTYEVELPTALYFSGPYPLVKEVIIEIKEMRPNDPIEPPTIKEEYEHNKEMQKYFVVKEDDLENVDQKLAVMPNISEENLNSIAKEIYTSTLMINDPVDVLCIDDPVVIKHLYIENNKKDENKRYIIKIYDDNGTEIIPREVKIFEKYVDILLTDALEDTIITVKLFQEIITDGSLI